MIIRISLILALSALPVFLLVDLLLRLTVPMLPEALARLGSVMLLSGFSVLIISALLSALKLIVRSALDYFSSKQRAQRRMWFAWVRQDQLERLFYYKTRQLSYFNELHRKRLLMHNDRKHIRLLSKVIDKDLSSMKSKLSESIYMQLQQDYVRYRKQKDIEALLKLQKKIFSLVNV